MLCALHRRQKAAFKKPEDNRLRSKDKQGEVLTGSFEDILFLLQATNC